MSIREEILPFIDGNGLVAPNLVPVGTIKGSDNGPMFTSEYYVMLNKIGILTDQDKIDFANKINQCIASDLLNRVPIGQSDGQEGPDDYYGVLNACFQLDNTTIPREFLKAVFKDMGSLDNVNPGAWQWGAFLIRQPQLLASMITAAFPTWNLLHIFIRLVFIPLYFWSAIILLFSCMFVPIDQADPRRLGWHLLQVVSKRSFTCKLASLIWYRRLKADYGLAEMQGVAAVYYQSGHPFIKYWVS